MSKRKSLMMIASSVVSSTAISTLTSIVAVNSTIVEAAPKKGEKSVECYGINSCKGTNGCGIGSDQITVANKVYKDKFAKSKSGDCAGTSDCAASKGFLAWINKKTEKECLDADGFIIEKGSDGKFVVKDKSGTKSS